MRSKLPLAVLAFAVLELWLLVVLGRAIGGGAVFLLVLAGGITGLSLARRHGRAALQAFQQGAVDGNVPAAVLADRAMLVVAGVAFMIPGVLSDLLALGLLLPPVRQRIAGRLHAGIEAKIRQRGVDLVRGAARRDLGDRSAVIDVDPADVREHDD
ncbi:MAG: FxsA family protein [Deltaproteobacteria bacterium]|jgi:UPF0716 protein FxsA|nr:FxsA family protein [Deltaproteobacteria bacterium]